jgi:hypothetical protein
MPAYVSEAELKRPVLDRKEIGERLLLVMLGTAAAVLGSAAGTIARRLNTDPKTR